ncbi:putative NLR family CARD domain-containing protein 4 [Apostichopus japonicus]|uniref:Putative NLR family CARD domain-containing protein 4 n=1 Tax=Stichopus japonicus TaxID=307972 RepID=A0A2G8KC35_STIJA|nr:putative NLR family CARD domain-containing protein 4 [Apostichopus japonicus]
MFDAKIIFLFLVFSSLSVGVAKGGRCKSPQSIEVGTRGVVSCQFTDGFTSIHWYNSSDYISDLPVVSYENTKKSGEGFESGEFDIQEDGSLVINRVAIKHETTFSVLQFKAGEQVPNIYQINIQTKITPQEICPVINRCGCIEDVCYNPGIVSNIELICKVERSRPPVVLTWKLRTSEEDIELESVSSNDSDSVTTSTAVGISYGGHNLSYVTMLVCDANDQLNLLTKSQSLIIMRNRGKPVSTEPINLTLKKSTDMKLYCSGASIVVWEKKLNDGSIKTLIVSYATRNFTKIYDNDYSFGQDNSLLLYNIDIHHEGLYSCVFGNHNTDEVKIFNVSVYVDPVPSYLVIDGCDHTKYCTLDAQLQEGSLTCSVSGIRPAVELEWRPFHTKSLEIMTLSNQQSKITTESGTSTVVHTTKYIIKKATDERLTLECRVVGENAGLFPLSTKIDLLLPNTIPTGRGQHTTLFPRTEQTNPQPIIIAVIAFVIIVMIILGLTIFFKRCCSKTTHHSDIYEKVPMIPQEPEHKSIFIKQLKQTYGEFYRTVQPIPYLMDRKYAINELFVEVGTECLINDDKTQRDKRWVSLGPHQNIFIDQRVKSRRRIIEAEPGYGKTTLVMQLAYEWCVGLAGPATSNILIVVKLRQLQGVSSIYDAIRRFLLPRESQLKIETIKDILAKEPSVLLILDAFDEYPDYESLTQTDILAILQKQMFPNFDVILTTRSAYLPRHFAPQTKRIRLTGFDSYAQDEYLKKAVTKDDENAADKIKEWLQDNPVLGDLCQVPLFFVLYAHLSLENDNLKDCSSVTVFFRYMVTCFHSHLTRKVYDENVKPLHSFEENHTKLKQVAFEALSKTPRSNSPGQKPEERASEILEDFDLSKFQYMYRFACGLSPTAAIHIIRYVQGAEGSDKFATLCILEQKGALIIPSLILHEAFSSVDTVRAEIILKSGLRLSTQNTFKELWIEQNGARITEQILTDVFLYILKCERLSSISFSYCLLPLHLNKTSVLSKLQEKNIEVLWYPSVVWYQLNIQSGHWQHKIGYNDLTEEEYNKEILMFGEMKNQIPLQAGSREEAIVALSNPQAHRSQSLRFICNVNDCELSVVNNSVTGRHTLILE